MPPALTLETGLPSVARIPKVIGHHSPSHQWGMLRRTLFLLNPPWARAIVLVLRCCTSTYYFVDGPHGPGHGSRSRSRTGLIGRDFKDLEACLRHYSSDFACRLVGYLGYFSNFLLMGKSIV